MFEGFISYISGNSRINHGIYSPPSTNIGLAGVGNLDDSDVTFVKLRASNIILILLHRDPMISKVESENHHQEYCMTEMSEIFFSQINEYSIQSLFGVNGDHIQESLLSICTYDHIR